MKPIRLAPEAAEELADAGAWYESQRIGLSRRLVGETQSTLRLVRERPASFPLLKTLSRLGIRRALLPHFPYAIVFLELDLEIRILAIAHLKRRPGYWLGRLEP